MPKVHQSTALVWPKPLMTSGAMYSSVPTNELVMMPGSVWSMLFSRTCGVSWTVEPLLRSKSVRTMWPVDVMRMFSGLRSR